MARPSKELINSIRRAAKRIAKEKNYQWGHMGSCNCGHLAQEVTKLSQSQIHDYAMKGHGDWSEQVEAFCPTSSMSMDLLISELISAGLSLEDLINLERLNDRQVLSTMSIEKRNKLRHNDPKDVAFYMEKWADLMCLQLVNIDEEIVIVD